MLEEKEMTAAASSVALRDEEGAVRADFVERVQQAIAADRDEPKACLGLADEIDAHRAYDFTIADERVRKMAMLEFVRVVLVIGLARQQRAEDRIPVNGMINAPLLRRSHRPQRVMLERMIHRCPCRIHSRLSA